MTPPKTKIVCTIGPSSNCPETIASLIESGMSVARLNFSHGTHEEHGIVIERLREASARLGRPVAILQDLGGPKIRVGTIPEGGLRLSAGEKMILTGDPGPARGNRVSVSFPNLSSQVGRGDRILLADGMMELVVEQTSGPDITSRVITGGVLTSHKGINLPSSTLDMPAMTEKDRRDLLYGLAMDVDYVALSFVRTAHDIFSIKDIIRSRTKSTPVIAKIEKHEALNHVDAILEASDGVMVARGDLGVEIRLEKVPGIQKMLIRKANALGKPVIIATQMLRSMVESPHPTRAEAADVANGVLDGADAVMLSEETAIGKYPVQSVRYMARIARSAEEEYLHAAYLNLPTHPGIAGAVAKAACSLAKNIDAVAIVATTRSGFTAAQIARYRPRQTVVALTPNQDAVRRLALYWGCIPHYLDTIEHTDEMVERAAAAVLVEGYAREGDTLVITAGRPLWETGTTNMLWVKTL
ncbi:MAG: pyruvate kinase [Syntrophales bacterium]|nr:pyruvate kinase [Syntrophales bacterium]MCK9527079.1 pyruvate kinase [Syntrophales bacterium]MDX9921796.1 pyruvate kinase [Syntrophales bacterium]